MTTLNRYKGQFGTVDDEVNGNILVTFLAPSAAPSKFQISNEGVEDERTSR